MNQYYLEERYPIAVASELTEQEITESLEALENLIAEIAASGG